MKFHGVSRGFPGSPRGFGRYFRKFSETFKEIKMFFSRFESHCLRGLSYSLLKRSWISLSRNTCNKCYQSSSHTGTRHLGFLNSVGYRVNSNVLFVSLILTLQVRLRRPECPVLCVEVVSIQHGPWLCVSCSPLCESSQIVLHNPEEIPTKNKKKLKIHYMK